MDRPSLEAAICLLRAQHTINWLSLHIIIWAYDYKMLCCTMPKWCNDPRLALSFKSRQRRVHVWLLIRMNDHFEEIERVRSILIYSNCDSSQTGSSKLEATNALYTVSSLISRLSTVSPQNMDYWTDKQNDTSDWLGNVFSSDSSVSSKYFRPIYSHLTY